MKETDQSQDLPDSRVEWLFSDEALKRGLTKGDASGDRGAAYKGHSSCAASKAAGTYFGAAKKSTLVAVKMRGLYRTETASIFDTVWQDIQSKSRQKKSVVTISWSSGNPTDNDHLSPSHAKMKREIQNLLNNDVIVVSSAGNHALEKDKEGKLRTNIDTAPSIFSSNTYPLIVVGNCDNTGERQASSQGGDSVTILAPGVDVVCSTDTGSLTIRRSGTSFCKLLPFIYRSRVRCSLCLTRYLQHSSAHPEFRKHRTERDTSISPD